MVEAYEEILARGGDESLRIACQFFTRNDAVLRTMRRITAALDAMGVAHAVVGGMALVVYGYVRTTLDVDVLVAADALAVTIDRLRKAGYLVLDAKRLRDAETGVRIDFVVSGTSGQSQIGRLLAFPDPAQAAVLIGGIPYLNMPALVQQKVALGMSHPGRLKHLADVQELMKARNEPGDFAAKLDPHVRPRFVELWDGVQQPSSVHPECSLPGDIDRRV
jgi:hypothetical protein